jgi:protein-S-isoprenylcysteine O-methyltransferase Ste14
MSTHDSSNASATTEEKAQANSRSKILKYADLAKTYKEYTPIPLLLLLFVYADPSAFSVLLGLVIIIAGEFLRICTVSHLLELKKVFPEDQFKVFESGPFTYVRAPLYLGNLLLAIGISFFSGAYSVMILTVIIGLAHYYLLLLLDEEKALEEFGEKFRDYRKKTPSFVPIKLPTKAVILRERNYSDAIEKETRTILSAGIIVLIILLFL